MQTAEFAVTQEIDYKPAFNWQVKHVLKSRDRLVARSESGKPDIF